MPLRIRHISKSYGGKAVLRDFSMELPENGRAGILGRSGGGKTTLLQIIAGITPADSGEIERPEGRVSYVFQEYRLLPWLTAEDNITETTGCGKALARELLTAMELEKEFRSYPDDLSGGMKQRLSIARALACPSRLILLDEPFKGLDPGLRERVIAKVDEYCAERTVILVTHDRVECEMLRCGFIYELDENK